ncbi:MAG: hypothetical protein JXB13_15150 [Phycisphaerae bacterium]|nr:hypothetical protein [Phycisphaerae bacterium]
MPDALNLVSNSRFTEGQRRPQDWRWIAQDPSCTYQRLPSKNGDPAGMQITVNGTMPRSGRPDGARLVWSQRVRAAGGQFYRIEAIFTLGGAPDQEVVSTAGIVLSVQPLKGRVPVGERLETPAAAAVDGTLRAFFRTPAGANGLDLRVGIRGPLPAVVVREVLVLPVLELELCSHPAAVPSPSYACAPPRVVKTIGLCGEVDEDRPLVRALRTRFGRQAVRVLNADALRKGPSRSAAQTGCDAILIQGTPPPPLRSMAALQTLAKDHLVVIGLSGLARVARGAVEVRTIRQKDDLLCATVYEANFITRGFALRDCFPFAWSGLNGADPRVFVHNQIRPTKAFAAFCRKHGFTVLLRSETDADASSDRPLSLFAGTPAGGLLVLDLEPIDTAPSTLNEPSIVLHLLLNALGADSTALGQYAVPAWTHREFWEQLLDVEQRFDSYGAAFEDLAAPYRPDMRPRLHVGRPTKTLGLPVVERPVILIRTGLSGSDTDGVYGVMNWIKALLRPAPYACPYAAALFSRFRLTWQTLCADWPRDVGWLRPEAEPATPGRLDPDRIAMVIDITNANTQTLRVAMPGASVLRRRAAIGLPALWNAVFAGRYFGRLPAAGQPLADQRHYAWQYDRLLPEVVTDDSPFDTAFHRSALASGAELVRLETPSSPADFECNSILRTDRVATLVELLIGLHGGMLVTNRRVSDLTLRLPEGLVSPRDALQILRATPDLARVDARAAAVRAAGQIALRPGEALCSFRPV